MRTQEIRKEASLLRGLCPRAPGIYRFRARMAQKPGGRLGRRPAIPASGSALGSHPCGALSSAQVFVSICPVIPAAENPLSLAVRTRYK